MRRTGLVASVAMLGLGVGVGGQSPLTIITAARVWTGAVTIQNGAVFVRDGKIEHVGARPATLPKDATVIELPRHTLIPGLVDLHTHMTYFWDGAPGTTPLKQPRREPAVTVKVSEANARKTLETGVTTARDLGAGGGTDLSLRDAINRGEVIGPRMFVSGQGISGGRGVATPEDTRTTVDARLGTAADWVKVYASRGSYNSVDTTQTIPFETLKIIVDAAHAKGRKVAIHSYGAFGVKDAVNAGADSVEHGIELDDETIREMAKRGTVWVPTIDHNRYYVDAKDEFGFPPGDIAPLQAYIEKNLESTRRAVNAGVKLGMGSDAVFTMFGQNTRELGWFVKAGMTPEQALVAGTRNGADLLGMGDRLGRLAPGYLADLVAVEGNPLTRIDDLFTGVKWVMKEGRVVVDKK